MSIERLTRYCEAYVAMATVAKYRPAAPGDGCGGIYLSKAELADQALLEQEAVKYATQFDKEEDTRRFNIGCTDFRTNRATIYTIEAARQLCGGHDGNSTALRLLKMAIKEVQAGDDLG
jgi:hypothetical protein